MNNFLAGLIRFFIAIIGASIWLFGVIALPVIFSWENETGMVVYVFGYLILSLLLYAYFHKRSKLVGDKSFTAVKLSVKEDIKKFIKELKDLVVGLFYLAIGLAVLALVVWGVMGVWGWMFSGDSNSYDYSTSNYSYEYDNSEDCSEPENPYDYGSGHYAGFEWGENGNYCSGNSNSFIEGCEEYEAQEEAYDECLSN